MSAPVPSLRLATFPVPLRHAVRHAAAEHRRAANVIVRLEDGAGHTGWGEGCPRPYVTGETEESALAFLRRHGPRILAEARDPDSLRAWIAAHDDAIDAAPSAFCAIELALLDLFGRQRGRPVESFVASPGGLGTLAYSAVLGEAPPLATALLGLRYRLSGFRDAKLKIGRDVARAAWNLRLLDGFARLRVDANNAFDGAEQALAALARLPRRFAAVEEPVGRGDIAGAERVGRTLGVPVVLDESLLTRHRIDEIAACGGRWIANLRVSKLGGLLRSVAVARAARRAGIPVIVGAQVGETSILARAALVLEAALGAPPWAREGAFGTRLLRDDLVDAPVMFGAGGLLDTTRCDALTRPGLGLAIRDERLIVAS